MSFLIRFLSAALTLALLADTVGVRPIHHRHHLRPRDRYAGSGCAGCHRHGHRADVAGHARDRHLGERRLHPPAAAGGCLHHHVSVERLRHRVAHRHACSGAVGPAVGGDGTGGTVRDRQRRRVPGRRADGHGTSGHELHTGAHEPAADRARSQRHAVAGSGSTSERTRRQLLDQRRASRSRTCSSSTASRSTRTSAARRPTSTSRTRCRKPRWRPAGISAEFGRFTGGVVNVITKSGGNSFSGSFRDTLNNDNWRKLTPFEETAIGGQGGVDLRVDKLVPTYEYTFGGPVMKDRLWFFLAGRLQKQESGRNTAITSIPYTFTQDTKRFEYKGTYSLDSDNRFVAAYTKSYRTELNNTFNQNASMDLASLGDRELPEDLLHVQLHGCRHLEALRRGPLFAAAAELHRQRIPLHRPREGHAPARPQPGQHPLLDRHLLRRLHPVRAARQPGLLRQGHVFPVHAGDRLAHHDVRLRQLQRRAAGQQPPVGQRLPHPRHQHHPPGDEHFPAVPRQRHDHHPVEPDPARQRRLELPHPLVLLQRRLARVRTG